MKIPTYRFFSLCCLAASLYVGPVRGQEIIEPDTIAHESGNGEDKPLIEKLKYIKQPGLANAASKIYSADRRYAISGFLEFNNVNYLGDKNTEVDDLELYYTGLYRSGTYFGYKITNRLIFNSELQLEFLHDRMREGHFEMNLELMMDYIFSEKFALRFGNFPMPLGYVNVMEEPTAFFTVNRPEVERILVPSQWLDLGVMFYGKFFDQIEYNVGVVKGLNALDFSEGAWIRPGRFHTIEAPKNLAAFGKLEYSGIPDLALALAGYHGNSGMQTPLNDTRRLKAPLTILSSYVMYDYKNLSLFGLGVWGNLGQTDELFNLTGRVIGARTLGLYSEARLDILPYFVKNIDQSLPREERQQLPVFVRLEQLKTHQRVHPGLVEAPRDELDLFNVTFGVNYRPKRNIAFKANYQIRNNRSAFAFFEEANRLEFGIGIIY